ncbi:MAG: hypothetical protein EBW68_11575, partial [Actinobacteria bacterium]|nr:hypothetical protein [Actinomycetota bacterium]
TNELCGGDPIFGQEKYLYTDTDKKIIKNGLIFITKNQINDTGYNIKLTILNKDDLIREIKKHTSRTEDGYIILLDNDNIVTKQIIDPKENLMKLKRQLGKLQNEVLLGEEVFVKNKPEKGYENFLKKKKDMLALFKKIEMIQFERKKVKQIEKEKKKLEIPTEDQIRKAMGLF